MNRAGNSGHQSSFPAHEGRWRRGIVRDARRRRCFFLARQLHARHQEAGATISHLVAHCCWGTKEDGDPDVMRHSSAVTDSCGDEKGVHQ